MLYKDIFTTGVYVFKMINQSVSRTAAKVWVQNCESHQVAAINV